MDREIPRSNGPSNVVYLSERRQGWLHLVPTHGQAEASWAPSEPRRLSSAEVAHRARMLEHLSLRLASAHE
jgi:hypothetical protein